MMLEKFIDIHKKNSYLSKEYTINCYKYVCYAPDTHFKKQTNFIEHYLHNNYEVKTETLIKERSFVLIINTKLHNSLKELFKSEKNFNVFENVKDNYYCGVKHLNGYLYIPHHKSQSLQFSENPVLYAEENTLYLIIKQETISFERFMLRYMRDTIIRWNENNGAFLFHSSAVTHGLNGIMMVGNKNAGKTTTMCHLLDSLEGFNFIANDRVLLSSNLDLTYVPLTIRISPKTIQTFNKLTQFYIDERDNLSRINLPVEKINTKNDKIEFTPYELSTAFDVKLSEKAKLKSIILPSFNISHDKVVCKKINDKQKASHLLAECCFTPYDERWIEPWITPRHQSDLSLEHSAQVFIDKIINSMSIYSLSFGPQANSSEIRDIVFNTL